MAGIKRNLKTLCVYTHEHFFKKRSQAVRPYQNDFLLLAYKVHKKERVSSGSNVDVEE